VGTDTVLVAIGFSLKYTPNPTLLQGWILLLVCWASSEFCLCGKEFSALHCMKTLNGISFLQILVQYYRYGDVVNLLQPLYMAALNLGENSGQNSTTF
jgi:hypothetical protein